MNESLVKNASDGDVQAFEELMREHEPRIWGICLRMMRNRDDALDCMQDAMMRIYKTIGRMDSPQYFSTWCYRVTTNVCLDALRAQKRRAASSLDTLLEDGFEPADERRQSPESALLQSERREQVRAAINELPDELRRILMLRELRGLSYQEIAQKLNLNLGTVKSRINRARNRLLEYLQKTELFKDGAV